MSYAIMSVILSNDEIWSAVVKYGKNQSTYKMALGNLLIGYAQKNREQVTLDELTNDFFNVYKDRMNNGQRQNKSKGKSTYVEQEVWGVEEDGVPETRALENIKQNSLKNMVLKRFNSIQGKKLPAPFYTFDDRNLHLNDNLLDVFSIKENTVKSVFKEPNTFPTYFDPKASIASSTTGIPYSFPKLFISSI